MTYIERLKRIGFNCFVFVWLTWWAARDRLELARKGLEAVLSWGGGSSENREGVSSLELRGGGGWNLGWAVAGEGGGGLGARAWGRGVTGAER